MRVGRAPSDHATTAWPASWKATFSIPTGSQVVAMMPNSFSPPSLPDGGAHLLTFLVQPRPRAAVPEKRVGTHCPYKTASSAPLITLHTPYGRFSGTAGSQAG